MEPNYAKAPPYNDQRILNTSMPYFPPAQQNIPIGIHPPPQNYDVAPLPVINQPQGNGYDPEWVPVPRQHISCPPGLEYLSMIDQLIVNQKVELLEAFIGFETQNKYVIRNTLGQKVYYAAEDSGCCERNCCGPLRPFEMNILDNNKHEVLHFHRPFACATCWFPCCLQYLEVSSPPGTVIGYVEQKWSILFPSFVIRNANRDVIFKIDGPFCTLSCCCQDVVFNILSADGNTQIGKITKHWSGLIKEGFTDADNFGITFPLDLDVRIKATLLGALFLIDFMFFETTREKGDSVGMF